MPQIENAYIFSLNVILVAVHYASAFALVGYGLRVLPDNQKSTLAIYVRLWEKVDDGACSRDLFVEDADLTHCGSIDVNIYVFCGLFGLVSGTYHLAFACWALIDDESVWIFKLGTFFTTLWGMMACNWDIGDSFPNKTSAAEKLVAPDNTWGTNGYRWFDYSASTSLMIVVIYVSFGIFDAFSCLLAATSIVLLMVLGYTLELVFSVGTPSAKPVAVNLIVIGFFALIAIFAPIIANMEVLMSSGCNEGGSKPPPAVQAVGFSLFALFASFGFVPIYAYNRFQLKDNADIGFLWCDIKYFGPHSIKRSKYLADLAYSTLSMWVKTFLHWGLATIVIGQSTMVQGSYDEAQEICSAPDFANLWGRFGYVITATTVSSFVTFLWGYQIIRTF